jgi:metallopeptidase MepB
MSMEQGTRYRRAVLEKGGSKDPLEMLTDILGRSPSPEALYLELGLDAASVKALTPEL